MSALQHDELVARAREIAPRLAARAAETDALRRHGADVVVTDLATLMEAR